MDRDNCFCTGSDEFGDRLGVDGKCYPRDVGKNRSGSEVDYGEDGAYKGEGGGDDFVSRSYI